MTSNGKMNGKYLSYKSIGFWLVIISATVTITACFVRLETRVDAMVSREQANKMTFANFVESTTEKLDLIIGNQVIIATKLGIDIER